MTPTKAAIAADSPYTVQAATRLAREGGNVVDIAVGAALAATVAEPLMCSLGGAGFFMLRPAGKAAELIDGADAVPTIHERPVPESDAWRTVHLPYGDGIAVKAGAASVAVPGTLAAADTAWKRHGQLPWHEIVAPAIELARTWLPAGTTLARWLSMSGRPLFWQQEASRRCFFPDGENVLQESQPFQIPHSADTLQAIADQGARTLYDGDLAATFSRELKNLGGLISRDDLAAYQAIVRKPLALKSRGFQLAMNPPPAVGGAAVGCLIALLDANWDSKMSDAERARLHAVSQRHLLGLREKVFADPNFDTCTAARFLETTGLSDPWNALQSPNTTHFSVVTSDGGMAAVTMSMGYGAGVVLPSLGIACNNSLGEPELNPHGYHTAPPGTRLVSNMAPTLAWHSDGRRLALGSPGASRITTAIAQTWARFALEDLTMEDAVEAPRLHVEPFDDGLRAQFEPDIDASLVNDDFIVRPFDAPDMYFGAVKLAALDQDGRFHAVADQRRHGSVDTVE